MLGSSAEIDDDGKDKQANYSDKLDAGEDELGFTVDRDGEDVEANDNDDDEGDPCGHIGAGGALPELYDDGRGGDLGADRDSGKVPTLQGKG